MEKREIEWNKEYFMIEESNFIIPSKLKDTKK